jgi:hypothetical protein
MSQPSLKVLAIRGQFALLRNAISFPPQTVTDVVSRFEAPLKCRRQICVGAKLLGEGKGFVATVHLF